MAKTLKCPACGQSGTLDDEVNFETRGHLHRKIVQKCLRCDSGLLVGMGPFGRPSIIEPDLWERMNQRFEDVMGADEGPQVSDYPEIDIATQEMLDLLFDVDDPSIIVVSSAAHDIAGAALELVARDDDDWANLDLPTVKAVVACAAAHYVALITRHHPQMRAVWADDYDVRPSELTRAVLTRYGEALLTETQQAALDEYIGAWESDDEDQASDVTMKLGRLIASARPGMEPSITSTMIWRTALHALRESFAEHFEAEIVRFSEA